MRDAIRAILNGALDHPATVYVSCGISFVLGLAFIFVWSPLPWGWQGIDGYDAIARSLARGNPFPTIHVPWGYAYFLAVWYWLFGNHPWIPLTVQALLNASIPLLLYYLVRLEIGSRVAAASAILVGLFSFNTVYTSTQSSDAVCTVLFLATILCFAFGRAQRRLAWFAASGLLAGLAYQFRPNLIFFPLLASVMYLGIRPHTSEKLRQVSVLVAVFVCVGAPWVIRNYRWSGLFVPATTHGGVQLWFGSLQTGAYEHSWLYNPRAAFEYPPLDYSSVVELPLVVTATLRCGGPPQSRVELVYWTNRDRRPVRAAAQPDANGDLLLTIPRQPAPSELSYYFEAWAVRDGRPVHATTPPAGAADPLLFVVSRDHLADLDVDGLALDIFDVARLMRHLSWGDPLPNAGRLDFDDDGRITDADLNLAVMWLADPGEINDPIAGFEHDASVATVRLGDGSTITVPRRWTGTITDLSVHGPTAAGLVKRSRSFAGLRARFARRLAAGAPADADACLALDHVAINQVPYRRLPHEMRRFTALALDNIRADPLAYLGASARRALRVFLIAGSGDEHTATQFAESRSIYRIARAVSILVLILFAAGVMVAIRRGHRLFMFLVPIAYVPLTICFMLVNARYSMTVQPLIFAIVAVALVAMADAALGEAP